MENKIREIINEFRNSDKAIEDFCSEKAKELQKAFPKETSSVGADQLSLELETALENCRESDFDASSIEEEIVCFLDCITE